jgi:hypothetical protein
MKKTLSMALTACLVLSVAGIAAAETPDSSDLQLDGSVHMEYRSDKNSNSIYGDADSTANGLKATLILNADKKLTNNLDIYARVASRYAAHDLGEHYAGDFIHAETNDSSTAIDQFGLKYHNAGWNYKLGSQNLSLGATGLLYDDNRFSGKNMFANALTATGKVGAIDLKTIIATTNYESGYNNDKLYYIHGGYNSNKSTYGFGYARVDYGTTTAAEYLYAADGNGLNYYTADFSYKLADNLHFSSEFIQSSAKEENHGINLVLFHIFNKNTNGGVAYFKVGEQANIQNAYEGGMTYQWGNAEGYGVFFNHKLSKNVTFNFADFQMSPINKAVSVKSGMRGEQNTLRIGATYNF